MKLIYNNIIPFKGFKAINLFGLCFVRKGMKMSEKDINHESIHTAVTGGVLVTQMDPL